MTNNIKNIEAVGDNCNNIENLHKKNDLTFKTSWIKCGEVFYNDLERPKFVCSICLKNANSKNTPYTTNDGSLFWWHIQQEHISVHCDTLQKISTEIASSASENVACKIACHDEISSSAHELVDCDDDEMNQNQTNLPEKSHQNSAKNNKIVEPEVCMSKNLDTKIEAKNVCEENRLHITEEDIRISNLKQNENNAQRFSTCNYYYNGPATYTISDDEDDEESSIKWVVRLGGENNNVRDDYLRHNDMIEISDDEVTEEYIETRPSSSTVMDENIVICEAEDKMENENTILNEDILSHASLVSGIPTPDVSPSDKFTAQDISYQLQNNIVEHNDDSELRYPKLLTTKKEKSFRSYQCELCGIRTINEVNMKKHIDKRHQAVCQEFPTHHNHQKYYHQIYRSHQNKQHELTHNYGQKYLRKFPFKCKSCRISTKTLKAMERHQQLFHGPDRPLLRQQCNICLKQILVGRFDIHMKIHFTARFKCNHCKAVYTQKAYLIRHISKYHPEDTNIIAGSENNTQQFKPNNLSFTKYATRYVPADFTHQLQQQFIYHDRADIRTYTSSGQPSQYLE